MNLSRRKPKKLYYMKKLNPLWIFRVRSAWARQAYLETGCVDITKEEYNSYPKKGRQ